MIAEAMRVLLVEDNPVDCRFIEWIFTNSGQPYRLEWVHGLGEGIGRLRSKPYDVVLLDLGLGDSYGVRTFQTIKAQAPSVPVVVLSAVDDEEVANQAVHEGAQDYLVKGRFDGDSLLRSLRYAIERQCLLRQLAESQERYALASAGANDGLWDWRLKGNQIYYSPRWKEMIGFEEREISDAPTEWIHRIHREDVDRFHTELTLHLRGITSHFEVEYRLQHKDGTHRWMLCRGLAVRDSNGATVRMAGSQTDITRRKLAESKLAFDAYHDGLTLLPNRVFLLKKLSRMLEPGRWRPDRLFGLLFVDFDRFKLINDSLGHAVGDGVLTGLARRLQECVRPGDTVARLGGDEFAILLDEIVDSTDAVRVAQRIIDRMHEPMTVQGHELVSSASIGIAVSSTVYEKPDDMLRDADTAMYRAKALGRGRYVVFDTRMHEHALRTLRMESDLRLAIKQGQLELYYQPIVALPACRISGFEALLRWHHPEWGLVSPCEFIPVAEESGLILPIGEWVIREACRWTEELRAHYPDRRLAINVNLSGRQILQGDLVKIVKQILSETKFEPGQLILRVEITETVLMEGTGTVTANLLELKELGIQLCIDDFGTGYSALSYLHRFPIDMLKIDKSFIDRLVAGPENSELVRTIVALAHSVGVEVVAEGIETPEQATMLRAMDCEYGQGFLFSTPVPARQARLLLDNESEQPATIPGAIGDDSGRRWPTRQPPEE